MESICFFPQDIGHWEPNAACHSKKTNKLKTGTLRNVAHLLGNNGNIMEKKKGGLHQNKNYFSATS